MNRDIEILDEPPQPAKRGHPRSPHTLAVIDAMEANPGKWVEVTGGVGHRLRREGYVLTSRNVRGVRRFYASRSVA